MEEAEAWPSLRNSPIAAPVEGGADTGSDVAADDSSSPDASSIDTSNIDASSIDALIDQFKSGRDGDAND